MHSPDQQPVRSERRRPGWRPRWSGAGVFATLVLLLLPAGSARAEGEDHIGRPGWPLYFAPGSEEGDRRFSLDLRDMTVAEAIRFCLQGTGLQFVDEDSLGTPAHGRLDSVTVAEALDDIVREHDLTWRVDGTQIVIGRREEATFHVGYIAEPDSPFWKELEGNLKSLLTPVGTLTISPRGGIVFLRDRPSAIRRIDGFLKNVEGDLGRQVNIESKLVEVALDEEQQVGVNWTAFAHGWNGVSGNTSNGGLVQLQTSNDEGVFQMGLIRTGRLEVLLDMLESHGNVRVISRPRLAAMGNEAAVFRVTENIPYYMQDVFTAQGSTPYIQYRVDFREAGVVLEVTAHASPDGNITLKVHPSVSSLTGYTASLPNLPPQPIVDERETRTTVRMREGETLVIGGLMHEREERSTRGVPVLSRVPLLGSLFRRSSTVSKKQELVVFLTPRVLTDALDSWQGDRSRYLGMSRPFTAGSPREYLALHEHGRGVREFLAGDLRQAVEAARRATALAPDRPEYRFNLALYLAASDRMGNAEADWTELLRRPETAEAARSNLQLLALWEGTARPDTVSLFGGAGAVDPVVTAAQALNESSRLEGLGRAGEARDVLEEGMNLLPRDEETLRLVLKNAREADVDRTGPAATPEAGPAEHD